MYFSRIIFSVYLALTTCSVAAIELTDSLHSLVLDAKQVLTLDNTADFTAAAVSDVETERLGPNSIAVYAPENAGFYNLVLSNNITRKHLLVIVKTPFNANNKQLNNRASSPKIEDGHDNWKRLTNEDLVVGKVFA